nr:DUF3592 domain-containing protein [Microlunatus panaciterrae]
MGLIACVYLAAMAGVFGLLMSKDVHFSSSAQIAQGTVIGMVRKPPAGSARNSDQNYKLQAYAPKIRFTVDGKTYDYVPSHGHYRQRYPVGDKVTLLYDPADPQESARIEGEGRLTTPLLLAGFALLSLAVAVLLVATRPGRERRHGRRSRRGADSA